MIVAIMPVYRYSTMAREIVKTFLVVTTPAKDNFDLFRFSHIYKTRAVVRISRGAVVAFQESAYLLGAGARRLLGGRMGRPGGLKVMALPLDDLQVDFRLVPGVYLSTALKWQPIVGRLALVHIGFASQLKKELTDDDIKPRPIRPDESLEEDVATTVGLPNGTNTDVNPADIAAFVRERIQNTTRYDRVNALDEIGFRALPIENLQAPVP